jgi:Flp pilus assembly protein TadG
MRKLMKRLILDRQGELDEAALVLPVLLLISLALINMAILGFAAVNAGNAANYGARMGSVAQTNPAGIAANSANKMLAAAPVGNYAVAVTGSDLPGDVMTVQIRYTVPNYFGGLAGFFGVSIPGSFTNTATSYFRQEGW